MERRQYRINSSRGAHLFKLLKLVSSSLTLTLVSTIQFINKIMKSTVRTELGR